MYMHYVTNVIMLCALGHDATVMCDHLFLAWFYSEPVSVVTVSIPGISTTQCCIIVLVHVVMYNSSN